MGFERFSVVRVPFPFTDRAATKNRPALVLSDVATFNTPTGHTVLAMITSQDTPAWSLGCPLQDLAACWASPQRIPEYSLVIAPTKAFIALADLKWSLACPLLRNYASNFLRWITVWSAVSWENHPK